MKVTSLSASLKPWSIQQDSFVCQVDEAEVERLHKAFYNKVADLFTQHKDTFKGYENVKLVMIM